MNKMKMWGGIAMMLCFLAGCTSTKQIAYLQDTPENYKQEIAQEYEIKIHSDDLLSIMVNSKDLELVQMFNLPSVRYEFGSKGAYSGGSSGILGYLVDKEGNIDFPQLGRIKVKGMTRSGLTDYIKGQLISKGLVNDPIVTIQFLNFKVSVMGEVNNPGTFEVSSDRITLLDVLSRAGDLTIYGKRENVKVIREENGERLVATVDLRSNDLFASPYYYLRQNDIVYVEPNSAKAGQREINQNRSIGTFASIVSVLISLSVLIFK